jgi:uncharacterized small protein (DUF1192 family)
MAKKRGTPGAQRVQATPAKPLTSDYLEAKLAIREAYIAELQGRLTDLRAENKRLDEHLNKRCHSLWAASDQLMLLRSEIKRLRASLDAWETGEV